MNFALLRSLAVVASFLIGVLAGLDVDRMVVGFPAWRRAGARAWAAYSREADLGRGRFLYPFLAFGHVLLMLMLLIGLHREGIRGALPVAYAAAALGLAGLLLTLRAAPFMLSLKRIGEDRQQLESAFRGFERWSRFRAVAQVLAFLASLWLLVQLCR
ncbi:MAG TPA: hypothetical protein VGX68_14995 [Thermoanaerobaculia bacterium]|jgi:hypothetical protein|nr:hypothetical protein [Thermoanaerobaculia bacterium]